MQSIMFKELSLPWQRVFLLTWESVLKGSMGIACVITNENGEIISEGRNRINEGYFLNFYTAHAENTAVMNLDVNLYPDTDSYTLYTGLEPCPMCLGTIVMGKIRHVIIAAKDALAGSMELLNANEYLKSKLTRVEYADEILGYVQRTLQVIREIKFDNSEKRMMNEYKAINVYNPESIDVGNDLVNEGYVDKVIQGELSFENMFDEIVNRICNK